LFGGYKCPEICQYYNDAMIKVSEYGMRSHSKVNIVKIPPVLN